MRNALTMTSIAVLMTAALPLAAQAASSDTSAKAKTQTGMMQGTKTDMNYPLAQVDDDNDGAADAEGHIVAGIDHDLDPDTPYLYAIDTDGDGVGDRWVSRPGDTGMYAPSGDYAMDPRTSSRSAWLDTDEDGHADTRSHIVADFDVDGEGGEPMYYAVDIDGDGYADRWIYHNEGLKPQG